MQVDCFFFVAIAIRSLERHTVTTEAYAVHAHVYVCTSEITIKACRLSDPRVCTLAKERSLCALANTHTRVFFIK